MFSKHQREGSSKQSSPAGHTNHNPGIFPHNNKVQPQVIRSMSLEGQTSVLGEQNGESSGQQPVAGPSGASPAARPVYLHFHGSLIGRARVLGSYSPLGMGQFCPKAPRQVINESEGNKAKKTFELDVIEESADNQEQPIEIVCAGDQDLEDIIAQAALDRQHINIFPRKQELFTKGNSGAAIITCAPLRYLFRKYCLRTDDSNSPPPPYSEWQGAYRSVIFEEIVAEYMECNPQFTEEFIRTNMPVEVVERIYFNMIGMEQGLSPECQDLSNLFLVGKPDYMRLIEVFNDDMTIDEILVKLAEEIIVALSGEAFRLFRVYPEGHPKFIEVYNQDASGGPPLWLTVSDPETQCMEALRRNSVMCFTRLTDPLILSTPCGDVFIRGRQTRGQLTNMILIPMFGHDSELTYFIEIWRGPLKFRVADVEIAKSFMIWSSFAIMYHFKWNSQRRLNQLNKFLLKSVKAVFEDVLSMDQVVKRTLEYAQTLVDADRASLFMLDDDSQELVARVFDLGGDGQASTSAEIRIPIDRGIAGHVALTGETVNIADAYADSHFNHEVDEATGYRTTSILCMPVKVDRKVIGVVQMVNKRSADHFSTEDERSFNIFSAFFGLALHNAGVYDIIARNEQKYRVALDVLSYHNTCRENEVLELRKLEPLPKEICLDDFYLDPFKFNPLEKCQAVLTMFNDLFSLKNFDYNSLTRFVLTVKKNYREVPYHNFHHGWSVAQSMYAILKADAVGRFNYKQRLALFVASLCHDLDHRGYTNKYMSETASPLASMYTTSTLEHHHFNITVTILQQDGHNIFDRFSSEEFKDMLGLIKTCILATDLAAFFPNLAQLKVECNRNYDWNNNEHSKLAMALSMTAADLSAAAKPWDIQIQTVKVIFEEFYDQGDKERNAGRKPILMMDRDKPQEQPASQVGFLTSICLPCYGLLKLLLPTTDKMFVMAVKNLEIWQQKATNAEVTETDLVETGDSSLHSNEDAGLTKAGENSPFSNEGMAGMTGSENRYVLQTLREIRGNDDGESHGSEEDDS